MTERRLLHDNKVQDKWLKCPTCRQHTDVGNIAYVDDRQNESSNSSLLQTLQDNEKHEASIVVQGSYSTKVFFHLAICTKLESLEICLRIVICFLYLFLYVHLFDLRVTVQKSPPDIHSGLWLV